MTELIFLVFPFLLYSACMTGHYLFDDMFICPTYEPAHYLPENRPPMQSRFLGLLLFRWTYRLCEPKAIRDKLRALFMDERETPWIEPPQPPYWTRMGPHHAVNCLLHGMNTIILYWLLDAVLPSHRAYLAAWIFAVHPVQAGSVCYLSGRSGMLAFLFAGSAMLIALQGRWELLPLAIVSGMLSRYGKEDGVLVLGWFAMLLTIYGTL